MGCFDERERGGESALPPVVVRLRVRMRVGEWAARGVGEERGSIVKEKGRGGGRERRGRGGEEREVTVRGQERRSE